MSENPAQYSEWVSAKWESPSRRPYTDPELWALRQNYAPAYLAPQFHNSADLVVIWTLLDMLEEQRGWRV